MNRVKRIIAALHYDFSQFELSDFIAAAAHYHRKEIILYPIPTDNYLHALWLTSKHAEYIFYNSRSHPLQQLHSILHEVGHILLKHKTVEIDTAILPETLLARVKSGLQGRHRKLDHVHDRDEIQAEAFATVVQMQVIGLQLEGELMGNTSSIQSLKTYVQSMKFVD